MALARRRWDGLSPDPATLAAELWSRSEAEAGETEVRVREIIDAVAGRGDGALVDLERRFDSARPTDSPLLIGPDELEASIRAIPPDLREAIELAAASVEGAARSELGAIGDASWDPAPGRHVEVVSRPVSAAGVYAPGGTAAYPSSVLMGAVVARVAGVPRVVVATPGHGGRPADATLAACRVAGVEEVLVAGGAQAVAALALGTESLAAVDVVVGPGNRFVTEAKRQLFGRVGIEGLAGPSELAVVAGSGADARAVALDLLAQAEHGTESPTLCVAWEEGLLDAIERELAALSVRSQRELGSFDLVLAPGLEASLSLVDALAPEHLQLSFDAATEELARERVGGCVFVGPAAATAFGDYAAGSNHVLPTRRSARFSGPLGVSSFLRRTSVVSLDARAASGLAPTVATLARAEGLEAHARSAEARLASEDG